MNKNNDKILLTCEATNDGLNCRVIKGGSSKKSCHCTKEVGIGLGGPIAKFSYACKAEKLKDIL